MSWVGTAAAAFVAVFPAELPDKTMVATIVLTTRTRRPRSVWVGAAAAFTVQVAIAVSAGRLLRLAPHRAVALVTTLLFGVGAVVLWRAHDNEDDDAPAVGGGRAVSVAFVTVLLAEFGDLTQLTTAGLAARSGSMFGVAIGSLLALWSVAALAATFGQKLVKRLPLATLRRGAACVMSVLALWSATGIFS